MGEDGVALPLLESALLAARIGVTPSRPSNMSLCAGACDLQVRSGTTSNQSKETDTINNGSKGTIPRSSMWGLF